jgi:O-antigen biosynthesis protein
LGEEYLVPPRGHYPDEFIWLVVPAYILIWLLSVYFSGGYEKPIKSMKIFRGLFIGSLIILVIYALLPEENRFSRAVIVLGALWSLISMFLFRNILSLFNLKTFRFDSDKSRNFIIVGEKDEAERVTSVLNQTSIKPGFIGLVSVSENGNKGNGFIGNVNQIKEIIEIYKIDEVIFCARNMSPQDIIDKMSELKGSQVEYKIAPPESLYIIGSNSINTSGDLYTVNINSVSKNENKRNKRLFDVITSLLLLILFPLMIFIVRNIPGYFSNIFLVILCYRSWVGYHSNETTSRLPSIRKGILDPADAFPKRSLDDEMQNRLNLVYARDYKIMNDLNILIKGIRELGRR